MLDPWDPNTERVRTIYVSESVKEYIESSTERAGQLHADFDRFIGGKLITASLVPYKARNAYMGLLHPVKDGLWDIRSQDPRPGLRVLGGFAEKDVFIALTIHERKLLGIGTSRLWSLATRGCKTEWVKRFHAYKPVYGVDLHDYISNSVSVDIDP